MAEGRKVQMVPGAVEVDGRAIHYAISDNPRSRFDDGPPQVWAVNLHGYLAGGRMYWRESARLAGALGWRVVNPNLPGFGGSEPLPWDELSMRGLARSVAGLLEALGAEPAVILGHSMGGAVAVQLAHDHPDRTLGVVYRDGAATTSWKERRSILARTLAPVSSDLAGVVDLAAAVAADVPDFVVGRVRSTLRGIVPDARRNLDGFADVLPVAALLFASDLTAEARQVGRDSAIPLYPLWGRFDRITPRRTAREFERVTGTRVSWVRGGHSWMIARPGTQLHRLRHDPAGREFLRSVERRAQTSQRLPADVISLPTGAAGV